MNDLAELRIEHPDVNLVARHIDCPDGVVRLLVIENWFWTKLDFLLRIGKIKEDNLIPYCLDIAEQSAAEDGWEFESAFLETYKYCIYMQYHYYEQEKNGVANIYWNTYSDE